MVRNLLIIVTFLLQIQGTASLSFSGRETDISLLMQEHMKKVKAENPEDYRSMSENAGGNITGCLSCHVKEDDRKSHFRFKKPPATDKRQE